MSSSPVIAIVGLVSATLTPATLGPLFADGFESGDVSAWSAIVGDDFAVTAAAALDGTFGLRIFPADSSAPTYVASSHPDSETEYRASFLVRETGLDQQPFTLFNARSTVGVVFQLRLFPPVLLLMAQGPELVHVAAPTCIAPDVTYEIEVRWRSPAPGSAGTLQLWIDGALVSVMDPSVLVEASLSEVRLGAVTAIFSGSGSLDVDRFESAATIPSLPDPLFAHGFECGVVDGWSEVVS